MEGKSLLAADDGDRDSIDLMALLSIMYRGWITIACFAGIFALLGILYLHFATYQYTATLIVVPTQAQSQNGLGRFGDLASLAGIDVSSTENVSPFSLYPEAMKSRAVADDMASRHPEIMHRLFLAAWDKQSGRWRNPGGVLHAVVGGIKSALGFPSASWTPPGGADLQEVVTDRVLTQLDTKKPVLTVTFRNADPVFARQFLQDLHDSTDRVLRRMTLDRAVKYSRYLENQIATVQLTALRQVLMNSLDEQQTLVMMSSSDTPFAAQPLSKVVSSMQPTNPKAGVVLLFAILFGVVIGGLAVFLGFPVFDVAIRGYLRRRSAAR